MRPALYALLWRREPAWLRQNVPDRATPKRTSRINWEFRDQQIANDVESAAVRLKGVIPPIRLTPTALLREAGHIWAVGKKLKLMPTTQLVLNKHVESRRDFAIRRINAIVAEQFDESASPRYWSLVRRAGLRPDILRDKKIQDLLRALIMERGTENQSEAMSGHDLFENRAVCDEQ
jgi:hypothetical protein